MPTTCGCHRSWSSSSLPSGRTRMRAFVSPVMSFGCLMARSIPSNADSHGGRSSSTYSREIDFRRRRRWSDVTASPRRAFLIRLSAPVRIGTCGYDSPHFSPASWFLSRYRSTASQPTGISIRLSCWKDARTESSTEFSRTAALPPGIPSSAACEDGFMRGTTRSWQSRTSGHRRFYRSGRRRLRLAIECTRRGTLCLLPKATAPW